MGGGEERKTPPTGVGGEKGASSSYAYTSCRPAASAAAHEADSRSRGRSRSESPPDPAESFARGPVSEDGDGDERIARPEDGGVQEGGGGGLPPPLPPPLILESGFAPRPSVRRSSSSYPASTAAPPPPSPGAYRVHRRNSLRLRPAAMASAADAEADSSTPPDSPTRESQAHEDETTTAADAEATPEAALDSTATPDANVHPVFEGRLPRRNSAPQASAFAIRTVSAISVVSISQDPSRDASARSLIRDASAHATAELPAVSSASDSSRSEQDNGPAPARYKGGGSRPWIAKAAIAIALLLAIVLGVALGFALRDRGDDASVTQTPPSSPPGELDGNAEDGDGDAPAPESKPPVFEALGSTITGPTNPIPGVTLSFTPQGLPKYGYSPTKSNMTFTGLSVALSGDGRTLAVASSGVDMIRTYRWDDEVEDWVNLADDIVARPDCLHVYDEQKQQQEDPQGRPQDDEEGGIFARQDDTEGAAQGASQGTSSAAAADGGDGSVRRRRAQGMLRGRLRRLQQQAAAADDDDVPPPVSTDAKRKPWLPCYMALGYDLLLSADGKVLVASAIGHDDSAGLVRTYKLVDAKTSTTTGSTKYLKPRWVQLGQDLTGDSPLDSFGGFLSLVPDGTTLAAGAPQAVHPTFAAALGIEPFAGRGYLRVYDWVEDDGEGGGGGGRWVQRGDDIVGRTETSGLGSSDLTADGTSVVVGTLFGGYVAVYEWNGGEWTPRGASLESPIGERDFGIPVRFASKDGSRIVVGSQYLSDPSAPTASANLVYLYDWVGSDGDGDGDGGGAGAEGRWRMLDRLVAVSGNAAEVRRHYLTVTPNGERLVAAFAGGVLVFDLVDGSRYVKRGEALEPGGRRLAVSDDGSVIAVGRPLDSSAGFGVGSASVYEDAGFT